MSAIFSKIYLIIKGSLTNKLALVLVLSAVGLGSIGSFATYHELASSHKPKTKTLAHSNSTDVNRKTSLVGVKVASTQSSSPSTTSSSSPAPVSQKSSVGQTTIPNPPACIKDTGWDNPPIGPVTNLDTLDNNIHEQIDPAQYYTVYGYTEDEVANEIWYQPCSPVLIGGTIYAAETLYYLSYYIGDFQLSDANDCIVTSYAVGAHFEQVFPQWVSSPYDSQGLATTWDTYITHLTNFENGHISNIMQGAYTLQNDIASYSVPAANDGCDNNLNNQLDDYLNGVIEQAYQTDHNYDVSSGYGATYGAVWPTD